MNLIKEAELKLFEENVSRKVFPDTKKGVIQMLKAFYKPSKFKNEGLDLDTAKFKADPYVDGCWQIDFAPPLPGFEKKREKYPRWIVYLAGYKNEWHKIREENDIEEGEVSKSQQPREGLDESHHGKYSNEEEIIKDLLGGKLNDAIPGYDFFITDVSLRDDRVGEEGPRYQASFDWEDEENFNNHGKGTVEFTCGFDKLSDGRYNIIDVTIFDLRGIKWAKINPSFLPK